VVLEGVGDESLEAELEADGASVPLAVSARTRPDDARFTILECAAPPDALDRLADLVILADGQRLTAPRSVRVLEVPGDPFTFLLTTDLHVLERGPGEAVYDRTGIAERLVETINSLRPEFVINIGDIISRYGLTPQDVLPVEAVRWQVRRAREVFLQLKVPMFVTLGNHDVAFPWCRQAWAESMGLPWDGETDDHSFDFGACHFTMLDGSAEYDEETLEVKRIPFSPAQIRWLADDLRQAASSRLRVLCYHYDYRKQLLPLLREHRVDAVFYGHAAHTLYEEEGEQPFMNGRLELKRAYQLATIEDGNLSVTPGPLYSDLADAPAVDPASLA